MSNELMKWAIEWNKWDGPFSKNKKKRENVGEIIWWIECESSVYGLHAWMMKIDWNPIELMLLSVIANDKSIA